MNDMAIETLRAVREALYEGYTHPSAAFTAARIITESGVLDDQPEPPREALLEDVYRQLLALVREVRALAVVGACHNDGARSIVEHIDKELAHLRSGACWFDLDAERHRKGSNRV